MFSANKTDKIRTRDSNPVSAAKALAAALPGNEPLVSLNALAGHLDRMRSQDIATPSEALEIAELIDRAGQTHYQTAHRQYVSDERRLTRFQEEQLWNNVMGYVGQLAHAYRYCLAKFRSGAPGSEFLEPSLGLICTRAMRLSAIRLKWTLLRYRRVEPTHWSELCGLYRFAESGGFGRTRVAIYSAAGANSSVEEEFLKALMLAIANPESLQQRQIEIADRLIAMHGHRFTIGARAADDLRHWVDLSSDNGPRRIEKDLEPGDSVRAFGAGGALAQFHSLLADIEEDTAKTALRRLVREFDGESVRAAIRHLVLHWGPTSPMRRHKRQDQEARVHVLRDFKDITAHVAGLTAEYPYNSEYETWLLDNESRSGLRVTITSPQGQWLRVGSLVALRKADEAIWRTCIVRRLSERSDGSRCAGVETIGQGGAGVTFVPLVVRGKTKPSSGLLCALLSTGGTRDEVTLLLPPATFSNTAAQEMRAYDQRYRLFPLRLVASGQGYEVARYRVVRIGD